MSELTESVSGFPGGKIAVCFHSLSNRIPWCEISLDAAGHKWKAEE